MSTTSGSNCCGKNLVLIIRPPPGEGHGLYLSNSYNYREGNELYVKPRPAVALAIWKIFVYSKNRATDQPTVGARRGFTE